MRKEIGLIIKMPKEVVSKEECIQQRVKYILKLMEWKINRDLKSKN